MSDYADLVFKEVRRCSGCSIVNEPDIDEMHAQTDIVELFTAHLGMFD